MRAPFKINTILRHENMNNTHVALKLFHTMVKPILLFGCQSMG